MRSTRSGTFPAHSEVCYKAVAVRNGHMLSIFDGVTEYRLHDLTHLSSGLWVCPSLPAQRHGQSLSGLAATGEPLRHEHTRAASGFGRAPSPLGRRSDAEDAAAL